MLVMLESYALERDDIAVRDSSHTAELDRESIVTTEEQAVESASKREAEIVAAVRYNDDITNEEEPLEMMEAAAVETPTVGACVDAADPKWWQLTGTKYSNRRIRFTHVFKRVLHNPVL
jgi:hypothetical protein